MVSTPDVQRYSGWPAALRVELAEVLDVVELHRQLAERLVVGVDRLHAREVQQRVEQHRGVARGQHEAVAVGPDRVLGVEAQEPLPELVGDRRHRHRRARVARVRRLDRIDRQRSDRVDAQLVELGLSVAEAVIQVPISVRVRAPLTAPDVEYEKRAAAEAAAALVEDGSTVGLGTGSTVAHLLPRARAARGSTCAASPPRPRPRSRPRAARPSRWSRSTASTGSTSRSTAPIRSTRPGGS